MLYIQQLAKSAQNWGIISPLLISVLKEIRQKRGESVQDISINFPWPEVPRGLDMSAARLQLKEWMKSPESLSRQLSSTKDRRAQKDAAFVLLMKKNTRSGINLQGWEDMLTQKDEVQARVQAALNDMLNDRAEMVLSQYDSIYGDDLFSAIARSELEVSKREYSMAYKRALSLFDRKEFAAKYYAIGWKSLFDELIDGKLSDGFKEEAFEVLQKVADKPWEKKLLATLCIKGSITCKGSYIGPQLINLLNSGKTESLVDYADHRSLWRIEKEFLELAIPYLTRLSTQNSQVEELRKAITKMKTLEEGTDNSKLLHRSAVAFADELDSVESKITARLDAERKPAKSSEGL